MRTFGTLSNDGTVVYCCQCDDTMPSTEIARLLGVSESHIAETPGGIPGWGKSGGEWLPPFRQISGANDPDNPDLAAGYGAGMRVWYEGAGWMNRVNGATLPPSMTQPTTWSRMDGTYVTPAGWEYQPGEDVTEDGGATWFRVTQATSFSPSASPSQYAQIDGPGGETVQPSDEPQPWVQPTGANDAYAAGSVVIHNGATWENTHGDGNSWEPGVFGWTKV